MLRKFLVFSFIFGCLFCTTSNAIAADPYDPAAPASYEPQLPDTGELDLLDLIAADFYENTLRRAQSFKIEAQTALNYQQLSRDARMRFRSERRAIWLALSDIQRQSLRSVKSPQFNNLSEAQKSPFREIALNQLTGAREQTQAQLSSSGNDI